MQKIITNDILLATATAASVLTNFEVVAKFSFSSICLAHCSQVMVLRLDAFIEGLVESPSKLCNKSPQVHLSQ